MTTITAFILGAFCGAIVAVVLMCCCVVSGRADDRTARYHALAPWVLWCRAALARYPDADDRTIVGEFCATAGTCRALLGAFGVEGNR